MIKSRYMLAGVFILLSNITFSQNLSLNQPDSIYRIMKRVANWQWKHVEKKGWRVAKYDWVNAAMYTGMMAFSEIANDTIYHHHLKTIGNDNKWNTGPRRRFADDYCIGQTYSQLYQIYKSPVMIEKFRLLADSLVALPNDESLEWKNNIYLREWAWCDALFMGPTAFAYLSTVSGDMKYLDAASKLWWKTTDFLYDKDEHLFYRDGRFFNQKEKNGAKMFWSRGNGWVMGGLVRMMNNMPANYPDRNRFETLFKDMAYRIADLQTADGTWHASLFDPDAYPSKETSGTGFYIYALTWGVNNGLLPEKKFMPVILKGWNSLMDCVQKDGRLGFVQIPASEAGKSTADDTEAYGTGAFLLAGSELLKMKLASGDFKDKMVIRNPYAKHRNDELIEIPYETFISRFSRAKRKPFKLMNILTNKELPYQLEFKGEKRPVNLLVQTTVAPGATLYIAVQEGVPATINARTFARFVPERKDDFAWENDKVAFRVYGPALASTSENAYGIDVWSKRTSDLIINKWYKSGDYHTDHGEGMDYYSVGKTLGAGDIVPYVKDSLYYTGNFKSYKVLDNGPLRSTFQFSYNPINVVGVPVTISKTISLDAGSQMNKIIAKFDYAGNGTFPVAVGIVKRKDNGGLLLNEKGGTLGYWEPEVPQSGITGLGCIMTSPVGEMKIASGHLLSIAQLSAQKSFTYYTGAAWNKAGVITNAQIWFNYLNNFKYKTEHPIEVFIK